MIFMFFNWARSAWDFIQHRTFGALFSVALLSPLLVQYVGDFFVVNNSAAQCKFWSHDWLHFMLSSCSGQVNSTVCTAHPCSDTFITLIGGGAPTWASPTWQNPHLQSGEGLLRYTARLCVIIQVWGNKDPNARTHMEQSWGKIIHFHVCIAQQILNIRQQNMLFLTDL